jgi:hypothetical protein
MADEKRKKTWREVDRGRDQTKHRRVDRPGTDPYAHRRNTSYKAELDRFFEKGVASDRIKDQIKKAASDRDPKAEADNPERVRLIRKVRTAETFDEFVQAVDTLRAGDGLPNDVDLLVRALEHPTEEVIRDALARLLGLASRLDLTSLKSIRIRLASLDNVVHDQETLEAMARLRERLFPEQTR